MAVMLSGCGDKTVQESKEVQGTAALEKELKQPEQGDEEITCYDVKLDPERVVPLETVEVTEKLTKESGTKFMKGKQTSHEHTGETITEVAFDELEDEKLEKLILEKNVDSIFDYSDRYETTVDDFQNYHSFIEGCKNLKEFGAEDSGDDFGWATFDGILCRKEKNRGYMILCPPAKSGEVTVPYGITLVEMCAFMDCEKIAAIQLSETVVEIEEGAFGGNTSCTSIDVDEKNPCFTSVDGVLFTKDKTELVAYPSGKEGESYEIPSGVKVIRAGAFKGADKLKEIQFPDTVEKIGNEAFRDCTSLISFESGKNMRELHAGAFYNCEKLQTVHFEPGLWIITEKVFDKTPLLKKITVPGTISKIYDKDDRYVIDEKRELPKREFVDAKGASKGTGTPDTSWYQKGKKNYEISTADEFAGLSQLVSEGVLFKDCIISLEADIDLREYDNWQPIGGRFKENGITKKRYFKGSFDGKNHTIYNVTILLEGKNHVGLFYWIDYGRAVENLNISGAHIIGDRYCGILAGGNEGVIRNCTVDGVVCGTSIVGGVTPTSFLGSIENCKNFATVKGNTYIGGICGSSRDGIKNCVNEGEVEGDHMVGGIAGESHFVDEIVGCVNKGVVHGKSLVEEITNDSMDVTYISGVSD